MADEETRAVLDFWFGELTPEQWFEKDAALDERIRRRFQGLVERLLAEGAEHWLTTPEGYLAAVIVLDQLPRNIYRNDPRAFAGDAAALAITEAAIARRVDRDLDLLQKKFLYMPFQHSEDRAVQVRSVAIFATLGDERTDWHAARHKEIIDRFGRFPHRNAALGRESTAEELAFLQEPHSSF